MRRTVEELQEYLPYHCNMSDEEFIAKFYADIPQYTINEDSVQYHDLAMSMAFANYGEFDVYRTEDGVVWISKVGRVLHADLNYKYRGKYYSIFFIDMYYGSPHFNIQRITATGINRFVMEESEAFSDIDKEIVESIIYDKMPDFGVGIQKAYDRFREVYEECAKNKKITYWV